MPGEWARVPPAEQQQMQATELSKNARQSNAKLASLFMYCTWPENAFVFMVVTTSGN